MQIPQMLFEMFGGDFLCVGIIFRCLSKAANTHLSNIGYEISDFIVEQRSGLAACSKTLYGLLHNQSVKTILTPNLCSLSRNILVAQDILNTAKRNNKKIISMDGEL